MFKNIQGLPELEWGRGGGKRNWKELGWGGFCIQPVWALIYRQWGAIDGFGASKWLTDCTSLALRTYCTLFRPHCRNLHRVSEEQEQNKAWKTVSSQFMMLFPREHITTAMLTTGITLSNWHRTIWFSNQTHPHFICWGKWRSEKGHDFPKDTQVTLRSYLKLITRSAFTHQVGTS